MDTSLTKNNSKKLQKAKSFRVNFETEKKASKLLIAANKKKFGKKIKFDHLMALALDLITDNHLETLKSNSLTNEDRKEELRQKYIELRGPISKDAFTGFMMSSDFLKFRDEIEKSKYTIEKLES